MPHTSPTPQPPGARASGWDRLAITLLGMAGFALSYDALRHMAIAIHIREPLTYAFPLVVDGFIAYGVRALLVLRGAPFTARAYTWTLFAAATAASVWANALHAVRLNQLAASSTGLYLSDQVVGFLSTLAPLALGGAVHLFTLITRHATTTSAALRSDAGRPHEIPADRTKQGSGTTPKSEAGNASKASDTPPMNPTRGARWANPPESTETVRHDADHAPDGQSARGDHPGHSDDRHSGEVPVTRPVGRPPGASLDELLAIGHKATTDSGRLSRSVVADAIRAEGISLSSDRLTLVMRRLREETDTPLTQT
ncbi:DUF2637 domain-containing protein [Allostreptomyces psammosilenae]|uniref:DUF2637 domain-containing protein n=1 Tax=Allostreptomyces psammosilenae TaxID=1892865 RepID=A0A852ZT05_9ACTN|nr:DUF2637 domain-containing protein [Allostreptomyces psammosilenae]NYI05556.1 hypothetical protein [Allostreptomyces psammosilenae]